MVARLAIWNWFILAVVLVVLELVVPGAFMLWLGIAAILVGADLACQWIGPGRSQVIAFAVLSVAAIPAVAACLPDAWKSQSIGRFSTAGHKGYVGRVFTLEKPIVDGIWHDPDRRHGVAG